MARRCVDESNPLFTVLDVLAEAAPHASESAVGYDSYLNTESSIAEKLPTFLETLPKVLGYLGVERHHVVADRRSSSTLSAEVPSPPLLGSAPPSPLPLLWTASSLVVRHSLRSHKTPRSLRGVSHYLMRGHVVDDQGAGVDESDYDVA